METKVININTYRLHQIPEFRCLFTDHKNAERQCRRVFLFHRLMTSRTPTWEVQTSGQCHSHVMDDDCTHVFACFAGKGY